MNGLNDEGAWNSSLENEGCLSVLNQVREELAREIDTEIDIGIDVASSTFYKTFYNYKNPTTYLKTREQIKYISELVDGVEDVFAALAKHHKTVHIISGGLRPAILPLAKLLNVLEENVHAVDVYFSENGDYLGYETKSPLVKNGGKATVVKSLQSTNLVMIGDGKTDLEAQQTGVKVIGFGGVVNRKVVREYADFFVSNKNMMAVLPLLF